MDTIDESKNVETESKITPWEVKGKVDYNRLVADFGMELISDAIKSRFERITGKSLHPWIKRGIFFSHRGMEKILDAYENGEHIFLYTGRGPSNDMHIGHMIPFMFTKWLQDVFDCPLVIQISDDEKFFFKDLDFETIHELGYENVKDIISFGFNPEKTFIFSNRDYRANVREYENFVSEMKKSISAKQVSKVFGFGKAIYTNGVENYIYKEDVTVGMMDWAFYQTAAAFSKSFPHIFNGDPAHCLVPYAIDQDNYFRMGRDIAAKTKLIKPCSIISTFLPPIRGSGKMSSSTGTEATIFLSDNADIIRSKIKKYAFSGSKGSGSLEDHKKYGGDLETDIPCNYLKYFEFDDEKYKETCEKFSKGEITCSDTKNLLIEKLIEIVENHQNIRKTIDDDLISKFYEHRAIDLKNKNIKNIVPDYTEEELEMLTLFKKFRIDYSVLKHKLIISEEVINDVATRVKGSICKFLILQDSKNENYLLIKNINMRVNCKEMGKSLAKDKLKILDKATIEENYNITHLSISMLLKYKLTVIIDENIKKSKFISFQTFGNDNTITISGLDLIHFIESQGSTIIFL